MVIQFLLTFVFLLGLVMTWRRAKQDAIRPVEALLWSLIWVGACVATWRPEVSTIVANRLGVGRGADAIFYASIAVLLVMVFNLHVAHERLERKLTELVRREALRDVPPSPPSV